MKTIDSLLGINQLNRGALAKIKGGNGNNSSQDEDAIGNQMRPRTSGIGGAMRPKSIGD